LRGSLATVAPAEVRIRALLGEPYACLL